MLNLLHASGEFSPPTHQTWNDSCSIDPLNSGNNSGLITLVLNAIRNILTHNQDNPPMVDKLYANSSTRR